MFACVCACTGACPLMNVRRREHQSDMPVHCPMHLATLIRAACNTNKSWQTRAQHLSVAPHITCETRRVCTGIGAGHRRHAVIVTCPQDDMPTPQLPSRACVSAMHCVASMCGMAGTG